jgi:5'-nucleotidase
MPDSDRAQILLTNDDGIRSPGLWAAAETLSSLGFVTVVAPREQQSGTGRSMPASSDGVIQEETVTVGGKSWKVYAVGGTPAQAVQHGVLEIMPNKPDLLVAGINYGENVGIGITISGTVGAALEGAALGLPSLAVSQQTGNLDHRSYSKEVSFEAAAGFTALFAKVLLEGKLMADVDVLKVEVPLGATQDTLWRVTRLSRFSYFVPVKPERGAWRESATLGYRENMEPSEVEPGTDVHALRIEGDVAVTPLSLDLTSRVDLADLASQVRARMPKAEEE